MRITTKYSPVSQSFSLSFDELYTGTFLTQDAMTVSYLFPLCANTVRGMALLPPQIERSSLLVLFYMRQVLSLFSKCVLECVSYHHPTWACVEALYPGMLFSVKHAHEYHYQLSMLVTCSIIYRS